MTKITLQSDGSLLFDKPPDLILKQYQQDPNNPLRFIPKFLPCVYRENKCKISECQKKFISLWTCSLKRIQVSTEVCENCNERKQG